MGKSSSPDLKRLLPAVALATFYVALAPVLVVWELESAGVLSSPVLAVAGVLVLSLAASSAGAAWWKQRRGPGDVLFGDLIAWSWIRRWGMERRLDEARPLLAGAGGPRRPPTSQARLLRSLASALEARDPYTHGHSRRVARFAVLIAKRMGVSEEMAAKVRIAAAVHDVGKIKVPPAVLNKRGRLTARERALIEGHVEGGARLVRGLGDEDIAAMVRHHHERLDGTGYPDGLAGAEVPLGSRIIAVADTFDALTSRRPYRRPNSHKTAMDILTVEAGSRLDPEAVRAFARYYSGRRALALWNGALLIPERLLSALTAGLSAGGAASTAQLLIATAATTLIGGTVVLSATPPAPAPDHASGRRARIAAVEAGVPPVHRGSLVSIPALLATGPSSLALAPASPSPGARRPRSGPRRGAAPRSRAGRPVRSGPETSSPAGPAAPGSGTGAGGSTTGAGGASAGPGGAAGDGALASTVAGRGDVLPRLAVPGGLLPAPPSPGSLLPGSSPSPLPPQPLIAPPAR